MLCLLVLCRVGDRWDRRYHSEMDLHRQATSSIGEGGGRKYITRGRQDERNRRKATGARQQAQGMGGGYLTCTINALHVGVGERAGAAPGRPLQPGETKGCRCCEGGSGIPGVRTLCTDRLQRE